jgi:hypothetical protein
MYLAAVAGVLVLLRVVFTVLAATERIVTGVEERKDENRGLRERVEQFTRSY